MSEPCPGSGQGRESPLSAIVKVHESTGKPARAKVTCRECAWTGTGRVRWTEAGVYVGRQVVVPNHSPRAA